MHGNITGYLNREAIARAAFASLFIVTSITLVWTLLSGAHLAAHASASSYTGHKRGIAETRNPARHPLRGRGNAGNSGLQVPPAASHKRGIAETWNPARGAGNSGLQIPTIRETAVPSVDPWGVAFDNNNNAWVAEPGCDPAPACSPQAGSIAQYNRQNFSLVQNFTEPAGYSSPLFLAVDVQGNIWFSEPSTNAIGELTVKNGSPNWNQWNVPTNNAMPYDLTFDGAGNLWFTEFNASNIGEFTPSTQQFVETPTPTANSNPYGIVGPDPSTGAIWFTENNSSVSQIGRFLPPASGSLNSGDIHEYLTKNRNNATPHLLAFDKRGHIWWSEGFNGYIGSLTINQASPGTSSGVSEYAVPQPQCDPGANCGTHISGIGVDSTGTIWFDDSLSSRIGSFVPGANTFSMNIIGGGTASNAHPHDGLAVDSNDNVWFTEEFANKLGELIQGSQAPVNRNWYFGEGRAGGGFQEFITLANPDPAHACVVNVQYMYSTGGGSPTSKKITMSIAQSTRATRSVNADLGFPSTQAAATSVSTFVIVDTTASPACSGIVAERPMYFHFGSNIQSGSDVLGATQTGKTFFFADVPTGGGYSSFLTILNPGTNTANVTASYYANGQKINSQHQQVPAAARGTINPNSLGLPQHVAAMITSDQPIVVERPDYFSNLNAGNAGVVSGGSCVMGAPALSNDWLFAEGTTRANFQEYFVIANLDTTVSANVSIKLEYKDGSSQVFTQTVNSQSLLSWNVSQNARPGDVSAEISSSGAQIIVEREMFFHYGTTSPVIGGTDVIGQPGPAGQSAYSFAEGYAGSGFNEWLTLQNPTPSAETLELTLINAGGQRYLQTLQLGPTTRLTLNISALVLEHLANNLSVSLTVESQNSAPFVAERPMYWNAGGSLPTRGGTDIIGYTGV